MSKWLALLTTIGLSVLTAVTPTVQSALGSHPTVTAILAGIAGVVLHLLPSPVASTPSASSTTATT